MDVKARAVRPSASKTLTKTHHEAGIPVHLPFIIVC